MSFKSENGVSLMSMIITVIIMFLIVGMIVYSSSNTIRVRDINNLNNDIKTLQEKVDLFYLEYGLLPYGLDYNKEPIRYEYVDTIDPSAPAEGYLSQAGINAYIGVIINSPYRNPNDNNVYYEIDLNNFENLALTNYSSSNPDKYVYVVNEQSHSVYLVSGIRVDQKYYYSPDYSEIPKIDI